MKLSHHNLGDGKAWFVRGLFSRVAKEYDLLLALLTLRQDGFWRRFTANATGLRPGGRAIDVASGTGLMAFELARRVGEGGHVVGFDLTAEMSKMALSKGQGPLKGSSVSFVVGRAESLPVLGQLFDAATISLALRNLSDIKKAFEEMKRAVRPDGVVATLDFSRPEKGLFRAVYYLYLLKLLPLVGRLVSRRWGEVLEYLGRSILKAPSTERISELMVEAGLSKIQVYNLTSGVVTLHVARRPKAKA